MDFPTSSGGIRRGNHSGNVAAAVFAGLTGYVFGLGAVFVILSLMALFSVGATLGINPRKIDHRAARGAAEKGDVAVAKFTVLFRSKELMVLGATLTLFHLGNAAMLPLLGQAGVAHDGSDPSAFTAATVVVAQATMVPMALFAARLEFFVLGQARASDFSGQSAPASRSPAPVRRP